MSHDPAEFQLASEPAATVENGPAGVVGSTGGSGWLESPTEAGNWLAQTEENETVYDSDVREICPGVFEARVHGYCYEFHPTSCLHRIVWARPNTLLCVPVDEHFF